MNIPVLRYGIDSLDKVFSRSQIDNESIISSVNSIVNDVKLRGDEALFDYTYRFDKINIDNTTIQVTQEEIARAYQQVEGALLCSLRKAVDNVLNYHKKQVIASDLSDSVGWIMRPMQRAGIYIPGGTAPYPSSVLMCALPAKAAGVEEIIMVTPNPRNPLTLVAANECGVDKIFKVGGAQAVSALAFGTESIPRVDIIAGPGNVYVTLAKKQVFGNVAIDMLAGPSEILIIADDTANADYIIADMLSQAEHDKMSASILITTSDKIADYVSKNIYDEANKLPRKDIARQSLVDNCAIIKVNSIDEALSLSDTIAPEHLELCIDNYKEVALKVKNAGAIFAGNHSPEPLGDYFAGPSHVLPTSGSARFFSVLSSTTFMKRISYIEYSSSQLNAVSNDIVRLAECEEFNAHALSIKVRRDK